MLTIKFADGELVKNVDWMSLPNKPIRYMDYATPERTIRMIGYERYLRLKVMASTLEGGFYGIKEIILIGQKGDICTKVTLKFFKGEGRKEENVPLSQVFQNKPVADEWWKRGMEGMEAKTLDI